MKRLVRWITFGALALPAAAQAAAPIPPAQLLAGAGGESALPVLLNESGDIVFEDLSFLSGEGAFFRPASPWDHYCRIYGVNPRGAVVGWCHAAPGGGTPIVATYWEPGRDVAWLAPGESVATAVNAGGEVVGYFDVNAAGRERHAFHWSKASGFEDLGRFTLYDVNDRGAAVGVRTEGDDWRTQTLVPVVWSREAGLRDLPVPEGFEDAWANRINNRGQVLGEAVPPQSSVYSPVFWDADGSVSVLAPLSGDGLFAADLNELGQVAGWSQVGREGVTSRPFLWSRTGGARELGSDDFWTGCRVEDLNNYGEAVGWCTDLAETRAFFWDGSERVELGRLGEGSVHTSALKINDSGLIVGVSYDLDGQEGTVPKPVTWQVPGHPKGPAPGSEVELPPEFDAVGMQRGAEGKELAFPVRATDPNDDPVTLSASGLPEGATFEAATGLFRWTPRQGQAGTFQVTFTAADDGAPALTAEEAVTILVAPSEDGDSGGGCFSTAAGGPSAGPLALAAAALAAAWFLRARR